MLGVQVHDFAVLIPVQHQADEVAADKTETTSNKKIHDNHSDMSELSPTIILLPFGRLSHSLILTFLPIRLSTKESTIRPSSPYSASKAAGDVFVLAYARTYGLEAMITRCTNNYGPYQFPEKLIPKTIIRAKEGLKIPIYGTGNNIRDWIYVTDHCRAIDLVLNAGKRGEIYNISAGEERTNLFIAKFILERLGKGEDQIEFVEDRPGHDARYSLDSSRIRQELGWRPEQSFEEGLGMTVEWYLNNPEWYRPLIDDSVLSATPWQLRW